MSFRLNTNSIELKSTTTNNKSELCSRLHPNSFVMVRLNALKLERFVCSALIWCAVPLAVFYFFPVTKDSSEKLKYSVGGEKFCPSLHAFGNMSHE